MFAQSPLERAVTLARERRYAEARKVLAGVAEPAGVQQRLAFHRLKAAVASGLGEAASAADEMRSALELAPGDPQLLTATAVAELQAGRLDDALRHARGAGNTALSQALIGDIQEKRGQYLEAVKAYQAAVELGPDREQYRITLALELVQHHTFEPAIAVLEQAAAVFPKSAKICTLLGITHYAAGHTEAAVTWLAKAIAADPKLEPAYTYLAQIALEGTGAPEKNILDALCGWNETVCSALRLRLAHENNDTALFNDATAGLKRAPAENAIARCELGRAYEWSGQWTGAREQMEACVRLNPSPQNHYRLGRIYSRLGFPELARRQMDLRDLAARQMSEEVARRESAVQAFQYMLK